MSLHYHVLPGGSVNGTVRVPGDKSISHRSIMFGAIAEGTTHVTGFLEGEDAIATMNAFRALGVKIEGPNQGEVTVHGVGLAGLKTPSTPLDCGNAGTAMRLMSGLLAGQGIQCTLVGDGSLSKRPMKRVTEPLALMGARIETAEKGCPPLVIHPTQTLQAINYVLPMASAQVKSAVLLAGLYAQGKTTVTEPAPTRDHTERMLSAFGCKVERQGASISIEGGQTLKATNIDVPADISSAAFFMVAASIAPNSEVVLQHVGINPTRTGIIDILRLMGGNLTLENQREVGGEPVADIRIKSAQLKGIHIPEHLVPLAIDEFPVLFIAAANAEGETVLTGAEELRVKESDRIQVMADGMKLLGVNALPTPDGMRIVGGKYHGTPEGVSIVSHGDHRIAMAFTIAALRASSPIHIAECEFVATSFPTFVELATTLGIGLKTQAKDDAA